MNKKKAMILTLCLLIILISFLLIAFSQNKSKPYEKQLKNIIMSAFENNGTNNEYPLLISDKMYWRISNNIDGGYNEDVKSKKLNIDVGFIKWYKKTSNVKVYLEFEGYDDKKM